MKFSFEINNDMQFGFENTVPKSDSIPKIAAGITELQLSGTSIYAAGKTMLIEEETE